MFIFVLLMKPKTTSYKKNKSSSIYIHGMPSVLQVAQNLENKYLHSAPRANREKIKRVLQIYRVNNNATRNTAEKVVMALYLPSAFGRVEKKGQLGKADEIYEDCLSIYQAEGDANGDQKGTTN